MARSVKTKATNTAPAAKSPRIPVGTAWETRNESFFAGGLKPADGRYENSQQLLELLPAAPEGQHYALKVFVRDIKDGRTVLDVILQLEDDYVPQD